MVRPKSKTAEILEEKYHSLRGIGLSHHSAAAAIRQANKEQDVSLSRSGVQLLIVRIMEDK